MKSAPKAKTVLPKAKPVGPTVGMHLTFPKPHMTPKLNEKMGRVVRG